LVVTIQMSANALTNSSAPGHRRRQRHPVALDDRREHQPAGDRGERRVHDARREPLDLPVDHRQQRPTEDEGEHRRELGAEAEPPERKANSRAVSALSQCFWTTACNVMARTVRIQAEDEFINLGDSAQDDLP
jgi:hypothetical protein